jgi:hypothetical protein
MMDQEVLRDERTEAVENASYRLAYCLLQFGVLICVAYRGFMFDQACWDLLGLVILTGWVAMAYQGAHQVLTWRFTRATIAILLLSALIGAVTAGVMQYLRLKT